MTLFQLNIGPKCMEGTEELSSTISTFIAYRETFGLPNSYAVLKALVPVPDRGYKNMY